MAEELSALEVKRLVHPGGDRPVYISVGGVSGLVMQLLPTGGRSWVLRVTISGKRRELGLGGYPDVPLALARERAREARDQIWRGFDPLAERKAARAALATAERRGLIFADAVDRYLEAKLDGFKNEKHKAQWRSTLTTYALPEIGQLLVADIGVQDVLRCIHPIWLTKTETATRVRGRIEAVLAWATVSGFRAGDNPAAWKGNLAELLPKATKVAKTENQPALSLDHAPAWLADLQARDGTATRALEFLALTAARSGEIRGARWSEIDLGKRLWIIPAERMKAGREHRVPLTPEAIAILENLPRENELVFPALRGGMLSDMSLSAAMRRIHEAKKANDLRADIDLLRAGYLDPRSGRPAVPHGLRSTFRDWAAERTEFPRDMAEISLAHTVGSEVERAYRRSDMVEKRHVMMAAWSRFLTGTEAEKVVVFKRSL